MTTVALSATPVTLDPGTAYDLTVTNSGTTTCHVQIGGGAVYDQRVNPGQAVVVHPNGNAVTAYARSGSGQVDTAITTNPEPTTGSGTYASKVAADQIDGQWLLTKFPWVHGAGAGENVIYGRTAIDALITPWNVTHDGIAGDLFHFTTGANTTASRTVSDGVTTSGSQVITSATAAWTPGPAASGVGTDIGKTIAGTGIPAGTFLSTLINTTVAAGSNGVALPTGTINVGSTTNFAASGTATIVLAGGVTTQVAYTGITSTSLTGVTGGSGTLATGQTVYSGQAAFMSAAATASGTGVTFTIGSGPNLNGAIIALGVDNGATGLIARNKYKGIAIQVDHLSTVASSSSYGLFVQNQAPSTAGPAMRVFQSGGATSFQIDATTAPAGAYAVKINDNGVGGSQLAGQIGADLGTFDWRRNVQTVAPNASGTPVIRVASEEDTSGLGTETFLTAKTTGGTYAGFAGMVIRRNTTGSASNTSIFGGRIGMDTTNADRLTIEAASGSTTRGSETWRKMIWFRGATGTTGGIGLYGTTPVAQPARVGQLTDSSGGTSGSATIAAVTDVATAANAIATLAAKVNSMEAKLSTAGGGIGVWA